VTAKALDIDQVGVEGASILFELVSGAGSIVRQDSVSNAAGDISASYVVTLTSDDMPDAVISAHTKGGAIAEQATITITTQSVSLSMLASPNNFRVASGGRGTSTISIRAVNNQGVGVAGIPVAIERIDGSDMATLTPVTKTDNTGIATSTLTLEPVSQTETVTVRSYINVGLSKEAEGSKKGIGALRRRMTNLFRADKETESGIDSYKGGINSISSVVSDTISVTMTPLEGAIDSVYVWVSPRNMQLPPDSNGVAMVNAVAYDENHNGITNVQFNFRVRNLQAGHPAGVISQPMPTDSTGTASAVLRTNRQFAPFGWIIEVRAKPADERFYSDTLRVTELPRPGGTLSMIAVPEYVYADNGITVSQIQAQLLDQDNVPIPNDTIRFGKSGEGTITGRAVTDSTGTAKAYFYSATESTDSTLISARYVRGTLSLYASTKVKIFPNRTVSTVFISLPSGDRYTVSTTDSVRVYATAQYDSGEPAAEGTPITFHQNIGLFSPSIAVTNENGVAATWYKMGPVAGVDTLYATAGETQPGGPVSSLHLPVTIMPRRPSRFGGIAADPSTVFTNSTDPAMIVASVVDTFGNPVVPGYNIFFTTDRGTVTSTAPTQDWTDPESGSLFKGIVFASFTPGTQAGVAKVIASYNSVVRDSTNITIISGTPSSLSLTSDVREISVAETGGNSTAIITARVTDSNGNLVQDATRVYFLLEVYPRDTDPDGINPTLNQSDGTELTNPFRPGNAPWNPTAVPQPFDSSLTNAGLATVAVNAGTQIGLMQIRAWTWADSSQRWVFGAPRVQSVFSELKVIAGPPATIGVEVNELGVDGGSGVWNLEVNARVADAYNNPVKDGVAVEFSVQPTIAQIEVENVYTGNADLGGTITAGVAHTIMSYNSSQTNDSLTITARALSRNGSYVTGELPDFNLPIQEPNGLLYADPINYDFTSEGTTVATFSISVYLADGHTRPINDQNILFLTTRGRFYTSPAGGANSQDNNAFTGPANTRPGGDSDDPGWAQRYLRVLFTEIFPDPRVLEATCTVSAEIVGYEDAAVEPVTLNFVHSQ
jgi:hypothetical protein